MKENIQSFETPFANKLYRLGARRQQESPDESYAANWLSPGQVVGG